MSIDIYGRGVFFKHVPGASECNMGTPTPWQEGDYSRAVIDFSWLVMAQPWSWRAHIALAGTWMMLKEYTTAINFYGHALMLDANHPEPVYQTGVCLKMMGEPGLAREAFQTAIKMSYADASWSEIRQNAQIMVDTLIA
ncbi:SycD/LcrH family type III secretion system chaperone [Salmonella enterica]|uniref:SycD/LcrH family type III secretion system chaperone n=1 Tax=Salmonella enterica TaxID=28901 RepID=UPI001E309605|nr:SycD/LcrH family type III secretion system chaperone [Salmonella enterica]